MLVPEYYVARVQTSIAPAEAGGLLIVGLTAHESLIDLLKVDEDDIVLITAAVVESDTWRCKWRHCSALGWPRRRAGA